MNFCEPNPKKHDMQISEFAEMNKNHDNVIVFGSEYMRKKAKFQDYIYLSFITNKDPCTLELSCTF